MKRISLLSAAALSIAFVFSCSKQLDTTVNRSPEMMAAPACSGSAADATPTLTNLAQTVTAGTPVTLSYGVASFDVTGFYAGQYQLFAFDSIGNGWLNVTNFTDITGAGNLTSSFTFTPKEDSVGDCGYRFKLQYVGQSPICVGSVKYQGKNDTKEFCVKVLPPCTAPVSLKGKVTCVAMDGDVATITMVYTVKTCGLSGPISLKTQGGLTAGGNNGAELISVVASSGMTPTVSTLNNNYVISATETFAASETKTYTVVYKRVLVAGDSISGNWSTSSNDVYPTANQTPLPAAPNTGCN